MRLLIQHRNRYRYPRPASLGQHTIRLRPATHAKAKIETYGLHIEQSCQVRWQQDPYGNHIARLTFKPAELVSSFDVLVELTVDIKPVNPFDFFLDERAEKVPFAYPAELAPDLVAFQNREGSAESEGPLLEAFLKTLPEGGKTMDFLVEVNRLVNERIRYVIREEPGIWTPEQTLTEGRGSCRDSAVLLIAALRSRGLAARFVSGYLVQLTDEGMIPNQPKGVGRDVVDLHAWAEVFLPGGGWIGLDATSGLFCGEGHIPLACTASPQLAAPIEGTSSVLADDVSFSMSVGRLGHEARPTTPYEEEVWDALVEGAALADKRLAKAGITMTIGGEPTFNSREHAEKPEWNEDALGPTKWSSGLALMSELRTRLSPGAVVLRRMGKHYPGESLPRWALDLCGRSDKTPVWSDAEIPAGKGIEDARRVMTALAARLGFADSPIAVYEDPWRLLQTEESLPVDVDPLTAKLSDSEDRRRLARVLDQGLGSEVGFVMPLSRHDGKWLTDKWLLRRKHLFLIPGDSPIGLRLPLSSLTAGAEVPPAFIEEPTEPHDPRRTDLVEKEKAKKLAKAEKAPSKAQPRGGTRTAICVEPRGDEVFVFLPPLETAEDFFALVAEIDAVRREAGVDVILEGYPPPSSASVYRLAVTPDPGVLEVNLPPTKGVREYVSLMETVFDAALHAGLHCEKYLVDGRQAGSGGGNHLTLGGTSPLASPFLARPDILASLITFLQHHPSLSYMFTGLFVGPTSQAPRVDEARTDALYELEIALERAFATDQGPPPPWLSDMLFRHLLVDVSGNTHRTELCIDKLFDPGTPHGRQGLVELRAFEMPPHYRMAVAQMLLVRSLLTSFAETPYKGPLVRYGQGLHDKFLLPYFLWRDFEDVLEYLKSRDLPLPDAAYRPFVDLRCPIVGTLRAEDITIEVRNAIEPWHVLGEETTATGTSRYVDSSMERIEVRARGFIPERHTVVVNGRALPMRPTRNSEEAVGGIRFRAWAPPHSLQPHLGIHHPIRLDIVDTWAKRSLGACAYHVWHPEGRAYAAPPLTRFEAAARRAQRFTLEGPMPWPSRVEPSSAHPEGPYTLDLRRFSGDRPPPPPDEEAPEAKA